MAGIKHRVIANPNKNDALKKLDAGIRNGISPDLILEGPTRADCVIETEQTLIWIEGKRNDWISPGTDWDVTRDQLARNLEAAWTLASAVAKDWWMVICHEDDLKYHEQLLIDGYRSATWSAGLPHLPNDVRNLFRTKIGTIRWTTILERWPILLT